MPEHVTNAVCHDLREEIYKTIFPRWAVIGLVIAVCAVLGIVFTRQWIINGRATTAMNKADIVEVKIEHLKEGQVMIQDQLTAQTSLIMSIKNGDDD